MLRDDQYGLEDVIYVALEGFGGSFDGLKRFIRILFPMQYDIRRGVLGKGIVKYLYGDETITRVGFYQGSFGS